MMLHVEAGPEVDAIPDVVRALLVAVVQVEWQLPDGTVRIASVRAESAAKEACEVAIWAATAIAQAGKIAFEDRMSATAH